MMNTKKVDSDDKGVKVRGPAYVKVFRDDVEVHDFKSTDVYMFPGSLRIDGLNPELVRLQYPNNPQDGKYDWNSDSGFRVFYTDSTGELYVTREGSIILMVSDNQQKQDGSFNVEFDTTPKLRVTGLFNAYAE